jgi:phosphinothricin acetyltransferase
MTGNVIVRDASEADLPAILDIYNHAVLNETSIWNDDVSISPVAASGGRREPRKGFPVYVADVDGTVSGFGTFGEFRPNQGYRFTVEHSIYVAPSVVQRRGIGSVPAHAALIAEARRHQTKHAMIGGPSHRTISRRCVAPAFWFRRNRAHAQVGFQFGRWLDLVIVRSCSLNFR